MFDVKLLQNNNNYETREGSQHVCHVYRDPLLKEDDNGEGDQWRPQVEGDGGSEWGRWWCWGLCWDGVGESDVGFSICTPWSIELNPNVSSLLSINSYNGFLGMGLKLLCSSDGDWLARIVSVLAIRMLWGLIRGMDLGMIWGLIIRWADLHFFLLV